MAAPVASHTSTAVILMLKVSIPGKWSSAIEYTINECKNDFSGQAILSNFASTMGNGRHNWKKIADSVTELQFAANNMTTIEVDNKKMTLIQKGGNLYTCAYKCPHAGGILSEGYIDAAGNIVCPLHRYRFNPQNGRNVSGEGYFLKNWPVEIRADGIYIGIEEKGLFHF